MLRLHAVRVVETCFARIALRVRSRRETASRNTRWIRDERLYPETC